MGIWSRFTGRRRAYDDDFGWHYGKIPEKLIFKGKEIDHPGRKCAIFLVHGMGTQARTETAANLRSGFEDAFGKISDWQKKNDIKKVAVTRNLPPPYIREGFWADYPDVEKTFEDEVKKFDIDEKNFFINLWKKRLSSPIRTYFWMLGKQFSLLSPRVIPKVGLWSWFSYFPLQLILFGTLTYSLIRYPKIISGYLTDVRLYLQPRGIVERTIVKKIDHETGRRFLELIGLDWDFNSLKGDDRLRIVKELADFERVVWVAHSLGTVISYNVLSDLFHRARKIKRNVTGEYTTEQIKNVDHFRNTLKRFVTMGSPLDKVAFLFNRTSLRPWPKVPREQLLGGGEDWSVRLEDEIKKDKAKKRASWMDYHRSFWKYLGYKNPLKSGKDESDKEWWINFYHALDPVSGPLNSELLFGDNTPVNRHIGLFRWPGWAHVSYWVDYRPLRYILSRAYGSVVYDEPCRPYRSGILKLMSFISKLLVFGAAWGIIYSIQYWEKLCPWYDKIYSAFKFIFGWG